MPGDVPVPSDYDGDGRADIAVWRPADGTWWIVNSGYLSGRTKKQYEVIQWGLPGDIPLPADYSGNGRSDTTIWRPATGTWFVRSSDTNSVETQQWGLPGDIPITADFNGDGVLDFSVWRPGNGFWYANHRNGTSSAIQWGLPGDQVPRSY
jgi:hypothetical protein